MTTTKQGIRIMLDEWLSDFGINDRFEYDISGSDSEMTIRHVAAKHRIVHQTQKTF